MVQSQEGRSLTIGKLAAGGGVGVETIRFYQRKGLLAQPVRNGAIRRYSAAHLQRLRFIRHAQAAGFTLEQIKDLLALDESHDRTRVQEMAAARVKALDQKIIELRQARDALDRLARECAGGGAGPCPILASLKS